MTPKQRSVESKLAEQTGFSIDDVSKLLTALARLAYSEAHTGFALPGFGIFTVIRGRTSEVANPFSGELALFQGRSQLQFAPDPAAEKSFLGGEPPTDFDATAKLAEPVTLPQVRLIPDKDDLRRAGLDVESAPKANNKLGGEPDWIQDPESVACCGREMTFYGQFDSGIGGDFNIVDAGMLYVFLCNECLLPRGLVQYY